jgi:hypothetical protein
VISPVPHSRSRHPSLFGPEEPRANYVIALAHDFIQKLWRPELPTDLVDAFMGVEAKRDKVAAFLRSPTFDQQAEFRDNILGLLTHA